MQIINGPAWAAPGNFTDPARDAAAVPHYPVVRSKTALARQLGPCVYFIRTENNLVKIGFTRNIARRKQAYGPGWDHVLAVVPGSLAEERALHRLFARALVKGREYFEPTAELIGFINELRARTGVPPIEE